MQKFIVTLFVILFTHVVHAQQEFWGTASSGGDHGNGFIFKTDSIGDNLTIVHHFKKEIDGENISALLHASNNKLYGMAASGGLGGSTSVFNGGTFFEYDLATDQFKVIEHLGPLSTNLPNVFMPKAEGRHALTEVSPGIIYGLAMQGNYIFSYNFNTGAFARPFILPNFQGGPTNSTLQNYIGETFFKASDGNFYATTFTNSSCPVANPNMGTILRLVLSNNTLAIRHKASCQAENGFAYNGHIIEANGKLYSTTNYGGASNQGVIFEYTPSTNSFMKRHDFHGGVLTNSYTPTSIVAKNNKLYGTSHGGGMPETNLPGGGGTLFEFDLTTNAFITKYNFLMNSNWLGDAGTFPSSLTNAVNGKLYGTTELGVFEYNIATDELRVAGRFWTRGFAPSIIQICRKPSYESQITTSHEVCSGAAFSLDLESPNATSVIWKHNGIEDATRTSTELSFQSFADEDEGTWVCTMSNECGSTTSQIITLTLNDPPRPTITTNGPLTFCFGETVTLSAPEGFVNYLWSTGETSRQIIVGESGDYSVRAFNTCESPVSELISVTTHQLPATPGAIQVVSYNKLKVIGNSAAYEWRLNDVVLNETSEEITVTESGVYEARGISEQGCLSAESASLSFVITATEQMVDNKISFHPNPASDIIYISMPEKSPGHAQLLIFNLNGQLVDTLQLQRTGDKHPVNINHLAAGVYYVLLKIGDKVFSDQIVIR